MSRDSQENVQWNDVPEESSSGKAMYAEVAVDRPIRQTFTYLVPPALLSVLQVGMRVHVQFGRKTMAGFVVRFESETTLKRIKSITSCIDDSPAVDANMLALTKWMAEYYFCSWGEALFAAMPAGGKGKSHARTIKVCETTFTPDEVDELRTKKTVTEKQWAVLKQVAMFNTELTSRQVADQCGVTQAIVKALHKKKLMSFQSKKIELDPYKSLHPERTLPLTLNDEQQQAYDAIAKTMQDGFQVHVLLGVTGSGKTEIYLQCIENAVAAGRQAIVLVPEISLTPQTASRFRSRFDRVEVVHSGLTPVQRGRIWQAIRRGDVDVVIGPRSAVFAPLPNLGLIVIDEEHDGSFKQQNTPRYNARDTAIMRAKLTGIPVVLGSATPSLEAYHHARTGKYNLLQLKERVHALPLPEVKRVAMGEEFKIQKRAVVMSRVLERAMNTTLEAGGQMMLFLNRRGYSTQVKCQMCGYEAECDRCAIIMTYHRRSGQLMCHYCNARIPIPTECPECGFVGLKYSGIGTEHVEEIMQALFPTYTVGRMDRDTMGSHDAYERILHSFSKGDIRILIGTQMITKGHDFADVTLVGIISADTALNLPDFRAAERTFQLITQVAGRTGRGDKGGRVIVQTFKPDHYAIRMASKHDYLQFASKELALREANGYPPFGRMVRVVCECTNQPMLENFCEGLQETLQRAAQQYGVLLLGPAPCPVAMVRNRHRMHMILKAKTARALHACMAYAGEQLYSTAKIRIAVDVDPVDMM